MIKKNNVSIPMVSVLMSTYKEPLSWIKKSVESILHQKYNNLQLVIIIDDPLRIDVSCYLESVDDKSNILIIKNDQNIGLVNSLNKGLSCCAGNYIARMDADDISDSERIPKQLEYLKANNLDIVGSFTSTFCDEKILNYNYTCFFNESCEKTLKYSNCIAHPTWLVKKEVYMSLKGYRNIDACEDYDFLLRAVNQGFRVGNIPEFLLLYRDNPASISHIKNIKQRVLCDYLAEQYRKDRIPTEEEVGTYLSSEKYGKAVRIEEQIIDFENRKSSLVHCFFNGIYLKRKIRNQIIKYYVFVDRSRF